MSQPYFSTILPSTSGRHRRGEPYDDDDDDGPPPPHARQRTVEFSSVSPSRSNSGLSKPSDQQRGQIHTGMHSRVQSASYICDDGTPLFKPSSPGQAAFIATGDNVLDADDVRPCTSDDFAPARLAPDSYDGGPPTTQHYPTNVPPIPHDTAFKQQTLKSWEPKASAPFVIACMLLVAASCIPLGATIIIASDRATELRVRYDDRNSYVYPTQTLNLNVTSAAGASAIGERSFVTGRILHAQGKRTRIHFNVTRHMQQPIYMSYALTNFYQNHFRYTESSSLTQLSGTFVSDKASLSKCVPFRSPGENNLDEDRKSRVEDRPIVIDGGTMTMSQMMYNPCGVVAWSLFNDSISVYRLPDGAAPPVLPAAGPIPGASLLCNASDFTASGDRILLNESANPCRKKGIAWPYDVNNRFKHAATETSQWSREFIKHHTTDNIYLQNGWYLNEPGHSLPSPDDLDLMVWMRIAPLSKFKKLHRILLHDMPPGNYALDIVEFFDSTSYRGTKEIVFASRTWIGGRNHPLGISFLVTGSIGLVLAIVVLVKSVFTHFVKGGKSKRD